MFLAITKRMRSQSKPKHKGRKSPRLNPFQYKMVGDTVSSHAYGRPESLSALALLGSIDMLFSSPPPPPK